MKEEISIQPMSPVKLKDMPIPHKIGPEPVPVTGYERAYSQGFRDGYAARTFRLSASFYVESASWP